MRRELSDTPYIETLKITDSTYEYAFIFFISFADVLLLHTALKSLTVEVHMQNEEIKELRNTIERTLKVKTDDNMIVQKLIEKYNRSLKLQNLNKFKDFEQQLTEDKDFLSDFVSYI